MINNRKSQNALEFMLIMLFVFFLLAIIVFAVGKYGVGYTKEGIQKERDDFASSILQEIDLLNTVQDGYSREFMVQKGTMERFNLSIYPVENYILIMDLEHNDPRDEITYYYDLPGNNTFNVSRRIDENGNYYFKLVKLS